MIYSIFSEAKRNVFTRADSKGSRIFGHSAAQPDTVSIPVPPTTQNANAIKRLCNAWRVIKYKAESLQAVDSNGREFCYYTITTAPIGGKA